jgi:hypothetical protein
LTNNHIRETQMAGNLIDIANGMRGSGAQRVNLSKAHADILGIDCPGNCIQLPAKSIVDAVDAMELNELRSKMEKAEAAAEGDEDNKPRRRRTT